MKRLLLCCTLVLSIVHTHAQTYVSGGIYANTTWTKAASPYIVTDTVVVFPGVTLTIEPGVAIKFNNDMALEIREASLIAEGISTDSITFTSNSPTPRDGSWSRVFLNKGSLPSTFKYCNFLYAQFGIEDFTDGELKFSNCKFIKNYFGIGERSTSRDWGTLITIDSSTFEYNTIYGMHLNLTNSKIRINYCNFSNNYSGFMGGNASTTNYSDFFIKNCIFDSNYHYGLNPGNRFLVENCHIGYNSVGISSQSVCKFKNCIIKYNDSIGLISATDTIINCQIFGNKKAIRCGYNSYLINNNIYNNEIAIQGGQSTILNNSIKNNTIGIIDLGNQIVSFNTIENDSIGIRLFDTTSEISCNKICNNWIFGIQYQGVFNTTVAKNYWCTPDSLSTAPLIFDGYDDPTFGLLKFMPLDTSCYKTLGIKENTVTIQSNIKLYPNPFTHTATLEFENPQSKSCHLSVFNSMGQLIMRIDNVKNNKIIIDRKELQSGLYFYQLRNEEAIIGSGKMMID